MNLNLNQITIQVKSVEQFVAFYELLGLKLIVKSFPEYARFECAAGDSTFSLHKLGENDQQASNTWIYFETEKLEACVQELQDKGIKMEHLPRDQPWLWREARLKDPDGHVIILYWAGTNRKNPPWRI